MLQALFIRNFKNVARNSNSIVCTNVLRHSLLWLIKEYYANAVMHEKGVKLKQYF